MKIYNGLDEKHTMSVQCKSGTSDSGVKYLEYKHHLDWSFSPSIFGTTVYQCVVNLGDREVTFSPFDMRRVNDEQGHRDYELCGPCAWRITHHGAFRFDNKLKYHIWKEIYTW